MSEFEYKIKLTTLENRLLTQKADDAGLECAAFLTGAVVEMLMGAPDESEDYCYITFEGLPANFHHSLDEVEEFVRDQVKESKNPWTIMTVHKDALETALVAVNHGVVIHSLEEVLNAG